MKEIMKGLHREKADLTDWIRLLEEEQGNLPKGRLVGRRLGGKTLLYHLYPVQEGEFETMKKVRLGDRTEERELAAALRRKALIKKCLPRLKHQRQAVERMIRSWHPLNLKVLEGTLPWPHKSLNKDYPCRTLSDLLGEKSLEQLSESRKKSAGK